MTDANADETSLRRRYLGWHHGALNLAYVVAMNGSMAAWLWWGPALVPFAAFVPLALLACVTQQRLLSEWFHEAAHWNLVPDRAWNDRLGDLLLGTFNGTRVRSIRPNHFRHHAVREFFGPDDPDTRVVAATTRAELARGILRDLTGVSALAAYFSTARGELGVKAARPGPAWFSWLLLVHGTGFGATLAAGRPDIYPLYFFSLMGLYPLANRARLYAQHGRLLPGGQAMLNGSSASRTFHGTLVEQLLLYSPVIMYHYQHHARPALPYRALRALSRPATDPDAFGTGGLRFVAAVVRGLPR